MKKLYEIPKDTKINVEHLKLFNGEEQLKELMFSHIDGAYSHCEDSKGNVVHLVAWAEVEIIDE